MNRPSRRAGTAGFTLLPVVLAMSLTASIAFLLNRDNGFNANLIGAHADRERARYAAEAGLQAANYAIQANACAGGYPITGSPVTDTDFGGATYSAHADNTTGSPLTLTSVGTYNGASVTLTRATVYAYQSPMRVWFSQPGPATGKDTHLNPTAPAFNYGGDNVLQLWALSYEVLVQFDLSPLPAGSRVVAWYDISTSRLEPGAKISLYKSNSGSAATDSINAQLVTQNWIPGNGNGGPQVSGATWNTHDGVNAWPSPGVGYDARPLSSSPFQWLPGWQDFDVTGVAQGWMSGVHPNHGIRLRAAGTSINNARYVASNNPVPANAAQRPMFTTHYLLPCGASAPA